MGQAVAVAGGHGNTVTVPWLPRMKASPQGSGLGIRLLHCCLLHHLRLGGSAASPCRCLPAALGPVAPVGQCEGPWSVRLLGQGAAVVAAAAVTVVAAAAAAVAAARQGSFCLRHSASAPAGVAAGRCGLRRLHQC